MELTNLSILIFILTLAPALLGTYLTISKNKSNYWLIAGVGITLFILVFKPVKLDSGYSSYTQQSFTTQRAPAPEFNSSVDQRYYDKSSELDQAQQQFNQRSGD